MTVYISCAPADNQRVSALYNQLQQDNYEPWWGVNDFLPGDNSTIVALQTISESDVFLLCISKDYDMVGLHYRELKEAKKQIELRLEGEYFIIPLLLEAGCKVPLTLQETVAVEYFEENFANYQKLCRALSALTNTPIPEAIPIPEAVNSGGFPAATPLVGTFNLTIEQTRNLAHQFLGCHPLRKLVFRQIVISYLPEAIQYGYTQARNDRTDVFNLVKYCLTVENGLKELLDAIYCVQGRTTQFGQLQYYMRTQNILV